MEPTAPPRPREIPSHLHAELIPVARKVFWWGEPKDWLDDRVRFVAQVMTYGDLEDIRTTIGTLGNKAFSEVLDNPPAGILDIKSWTFWHRRFGRDVPPLPQRKL